MDREIRAEVRIGRLEGGYRIEVREQPSTGPSRAFAAVEAYDIDTALRMMVPYLASLAEPSPLGAALERALLRAEEPRA